MDSTKSQTPSNRKRKTTSTDDKENTSALQPSSTNISVARTLQYNQNSTPLSCVTNNVQQSSYSNHAHINSSNTSASFKCGRPHKYQLSTTYISPASSLCSPVNLNSTIENTQAPRLMGRPPKYSISSEDVIPFDISSVTNNDGIATAPINTISSNGIPFWNHYSLAHCSSPNQYSINHNVHFNSAERNAPANNKEIFRQHSGNVRPRGRPRKYHLDPEDLFPLKLTESVTSSDHTSHIKFRGISNVYLDIGDPIYVCNSCKAKLWMSEATRGNKTLAKRIYSLCCYNGKVVIPNLSQPPRYLLDLFRGNSEKSKNFIENIRRYNMMFSFTSMGGKIDHMINSGRGPYVYRMHGQNYHLAGSLLPEEGEIPKFSQLYIYDTENEVEHRISAYGCRKDKSKTNPYPIDDDTVHKIQGLLDVINPLVEKFRMARDRFLMNNKEPIRLKLIGRRDKDGRTYNLPTANEVAALIVGDIDGFADQRDIILETKSKNLQRISELHPQYLPLQYPLLFPYAEDGYRKDIYHKGVNDEDISGHIRLTIREFFAYRIQMRVGEVSLILMSRKLFQQFLVDAYTMVENARLSFIRNNQKTFRVSSLINLYEAQDSGSLDVSDMGNRVILPSSFTGGARYMQQNYLDAMAIVKAFGYPDLFITLTCNPKWPEVVRVLEAEGLNSEDRPDLITRVFKIKLDSLISQLKDEKVLGSVNAVVYTIEFQKRGLPHCHLCLFLDKADKLPNPADIDRVISAEIPNKDEEPELYAIVSEFMMHGPCGDDNPYCPCMKKGKCSKHFPRDFTNETHIDDDGYPRYRRRDNGNFIQKGSAKLDNRHVVGYNKTLIKKFQAHMNVEWCNQMGSIKYLFKYINKGPDRITVSFQDYDAEKNKQKITKKKDEIVDYYSCRYISACEACWRLFNFEIVYRTPAVYRLAFHLPNHQPVVFDADDNIDSVLSSPSVGTSQFLEWMERNKADNQARELTYVEFPRYYVWNVKIRKWTRRFGQKTVGRINFVPPKAGETYYLRILLNKVRGPTCFEDIRTVDGKVHATFKEACYALGLLDDDKEYVDCIKETYDWASGSFCRALFVSLVTSDSLSRPDHVWKQTCDWLSEDLKYRCHPSILLKGGLELKRVLHNLALADLEKRLKSSGMSLKNIPNMPFPEFDFIDTTCNMLIHDELDYAKESLEEEHNSLFSTMTDEQKYVYQTIVDAVFLDEGGLFFLYGYGGTGKTFVWKTLAAAVRSRGEIVVNVASSGIASLLLTGGRTAHSRFAIPINLTEQSFCSIAPDSDLAGLLNRAKLIIWDEAPMMHRHCFEAFDRTMRDIIRSPNRSKPFGGKVVVLGGDFRQILPVIPKGTRAEIVHASIHSSHLWRHCRVLTLTKNMRLRGGSNEQDMLEIKQFAEWILKIGEGKLEEPNDGEADVEFAPEVLLESHSNHVTTIVNSIYPSLFDHLNDPQYFQDKAILAPTNEDVDLINEHILSTMTNPEHVYYSSDSLSPIENEDNFDQQVYSPEVLNSLKVPGVPNHKLALKIGVPIMLLRNIDQSSGLCNGTRLLVERLGTHVIEARIITTSFFGNMTYIPRMLITPTDKRIPFKFQRRQFPVSVCFAMTINKSQGQSLSNVGLFLRKPVFTHGQLYVAVSRVTSKKGLKVLILNEDGNPTNKTKNVVYKEVLQRIS